MVGNTGRATDTRRIRHLKTPQSIEVEADEAGVPLRLRLGIAWAEVALMRRPWCIEQHWWRGIALRRTYYQVASANEPPLTIYRDLQTGEWSRQQYS